MKKFLFLLSLITFSALAQASGVQLSLEKPGNDLKDKASLQRGAILFSNYCMACHSVKYMRFNRIARDLGWSDEEILAKVAYGQNRIVDNVMTRMPAGVDMEVLGTVVPDLSLMARLRGSDYVYSFIRGFEYDEATEEWDNHLLKGTAMPNVLESLRRHATHEEFDQATRDLTNFLEYVGEPVKVDRQELGWKVMLFLFVLFFFTYLLKKEYWRDVKH